MAGLGQYVMIGVMFKNNGILLFGYRNDPVPYSYAQYHLYGGAYFNTALYAANFIASGDTLTFEATTSGMSGVPIMCIYGLL